MRRLFSIIFLVCILVLISTHLYAAPKVQFRDFKWGSSIEEVEEALLKGGFSITVIRSKFKRDASNISYSDTVFGEKAHVKLFFTKETEKLYIIIIKWDSIKMGTALQKLTEVYGKPQQSTDDKNDICIYSWIQDEGEIVLIKEQSRVTMGYSSMFYYKK